MKNKQMYETAIERRKAFEKYFRKCLKNEESPKGEFDWLELECEIELKPCPFCNGEARVCDYETSVATYYFVECKKCFSRTDYFIKRKREEAIDAWNRRAQ